MVTADRASSRGDTQEAIHLLREAKHKGRPIVPMVGTGVSAEGGLPTMEGLIRYLARLRAYVSGRAYLPGEATGCNGNMAEQLRDFVQKHGWPDPFQLNEDLSFHVRKQWQARSAASPRPFLLDRLAAAQLDEFARDIYPDRAGALAELLERNRNTPAVGPALHPLPRSDIWDHCGNWNDLVRYVTRHDRDLAGALVARFTTGRRPALSHRFLAFLTRILGLNLFFTTTFDELLERSLELERIPYRAFSMDGSRNLPNPFVLRDLTAIIRLYGSNHRGLVDERIDAPLTEPLRDRFLQILPADALLLVLGCGARDERVLELIRLTLENGAGSEPQVLWMHYEDTLPARVQQLPRRRRRSAHVDDVGLFLSHLYSALYSRHPESPRDAPYVAHPSRPVALSVPPRDPRAALVRGRTYTNAARNFFLFTNVDALTGANYWPDVATPCASDRLAVFINRQKDFTPIWIDLEEQYTLAGVVGSIIEQCRTYDTELAPSVLPIDERPPAEGESPGLSRVVHALRRHRYLLVLDALESYPWAPTVHHGLHDTDPQQKIRLNALVRFIGDLKRRVHELAGSVVCVSVNWPQPRRFPADPSEHRAFCERWDWFQIIQDQVTLLLDESSGDGLKPWGAPFHDPPDCPALNFSPPTPADFFLPAPPEVEACLRQFGFQPDAARRRGSLALAYLACFRRTRNLVAMHSLLRPLVQQPHEALPAGECYERVDQVLQAFQKANYLTPVAGGGLWMGGILRDQIYSQNSSCSSTPNIVECLRALHRPSAEPAPPARVIHETALPQLLYLALLHYRIGRYYFADNFHKSGDFFAYFEYLYHRVSEIRYLTRLLLLLHYKPEGMPFDPWWEEFRDMVWSYLHHPERLDDPEGFRRDAAGAMPPPSLAEWIRQTSRRRVEEVRTLYNSLLRTRTSLHARVPAEQLIYWCNFLLRDDLPRFECDYYLRRANEQRETDGLAKLDFLIDEDAPLLEQSLPLRILLHDLVTRSRRDRGDAQGCIQRRFYQIRRALADREEQINLRDGKPWGQRFQEDAPRAEKPEDRFRILDWYLDIAACLVESGAPADTRKLLEGIVTATESEKSGIHQADRDYLWLRATLFRATLQLKTVDYWSFIPARGDSFFQTEKVKAVHEAVRRMAEVALDRVRPVGYLPSHPELGDVYDLFRSLFRVVAGRAAWLGGVPWFHDAYLEFERGRGAGEGDDRLVSARVDLFAAECALVHAEEETAAGQSMRTAQTKYELSAAYLQRAYDHLLHSRRNAIWWKFYYQLVAQHAARYNLWKLLRGLLDLGDGRTNGHAEGRSPRRRSSDRAEQEAAIAAWAPRFYAGVRRGLHAVRTGLDYSLPQPDEPTCIDHWLLRIYCELYFGTAAFGILAGGSDDGRLEENWRWLHETAGLRERLPRVDPTSDELHANLLDNRDRTLDQLRKFADQPSNRGADVRRTILTSARGLAWQFTDQLSPQAATVV